MMAAMGALKMADMAPAAAQPISKVLEVWLRWKSLAIFELMAAPVATVGPSKPTEPPKPTVMGAVKSEPNIWYCFKIPFRLDIAYSVEGIPWLTFFLRTYLMMRNTKLKPIMGKTK